MMGNVEAFRCRNGSAGLPGKQIFVGSPGSHLASALMPKRLGVELNLDASSNRLA